MQTRKFDELISYFNRNVSNMSIDQKCKIELLGMITAIGLAHEKELHNPAIEPQRKTGHWILHPEQEENIFGAKTIECSECGDKCLVQFVEKEKYCRNCGAKMEEGEADDQQRERDRVDNRR